MQYEGHGRSDGTLSLVTDWDKVIEDAVSFFRETLTNDVKFQGKPAFLMGESMGGAVAFCTYKETPEMFKGVVFYAPMLKIADEMKPPQFVTDFLMSIIGKPGSNYLLGTLPLSPSADVITKVFKSKETRWFSLQHPLTYRRKPRLSTSREMLVGNSVGGSLRFHMLFFLSIFYRIIMVLFFVHQSNSTLPAILRSQWTHLMDLSLSYTGAQIW